MREWVCLRMSIDRVKGSVNRHTRKSSLARQTVMQPQAEEQSAHMSQVSVAQWPESVCSYYELVDNVYT